MKNTINTWLKAGMIILALSMTILYPLFEFTYSGDAFELYRYVVQYVGVLIISAGNFLIFKMFYPERKTASAAFEALFTAILIYVIALATGRRFLYFADLFTLAVWPLVCYVLAKKSSSSAIGRNNAIAGYSIYSAATVAFIFITEEVLFRYPYFQADVVGEVYMYAVAVIAYFVYAVSKKDRRFCAKEIVFAILLTLGIAAVWFMCQDRICEIRETLKYSYTDVSVDGDLENWLAHRVRMLYASVRGDLTALNFHYIPALKSGCPVMWIVSAGGWWAGALIFALALALGALVGVYAFRTESTAERIVCIGFLLKMAFGIADNMFMVFSSSVGIPLVKFSFDIIALVFIVFGSAIKAKMNSMNYNFDRFIKAQKHSYKTALAEIKNGSKRTHWMWYIFPQLKELGRSSTAKYYGIEDFEEAKMYLAHPVLGTRLRKISKALLKLETNDPYRVMGDIDGLKLCSSMTLFAEIEGYDSVFGKVIDKYYNGNKDMNTIRILHNGD